MTITFHGETARITVTGDLDRAAAPEFESAARSLLESSRIVVVDISGTTLVDSAALGSLIGLHRSAGDAGRHLEIIISPAYQQVLFSTAGLTDFLDLKVC